MKRILWICLVVLFMFPQFSLAGIIGPASVRYVDGDVMFKTPDNDEWLPTAINTPLDEGDAIWCPDGSKAEIQLPDGSIVRIDEGSQLDLLANEDGFTHLHLASGRLYLRTSQTSATDSLQIDADDTTVIPAARTRLRLDMLPNSQEDVAIFKGTAYVEGNGSRTKVRSGEHIALEEGHSELLPLNPSDIWEYWNVDRDRAQSRSSKAESYLPDELRSHSAEFDTNGTWVRDPEYGMIWRPIVMVSNDWAPYRNGRWIWKGDDYVWISYENWGWVPYHYGRWAVVQGYGWCWVPPVRGDVYWSPGYVGWHANGSSVGWTPLAPGEIFYGRRYYGRHSVIISNKTINTTTVVYRNQLKPGGLTVVQHNDFLRGITVLKKPARNASATISVSVGSPRVKPLRESRMPIIKQISPKVVPPRIENRNNQELRSQFPRLLQESGSQHRSQQTAPVATVPASPSSKLQPVKEKRIVNPVTTPNTTKIDSGTRPHDVPSKRDEIYQRQPAPQTIQQPSTTPAIPRISPQKPEPQKQGPPAPITTPVAQPREQIKREENRQQPTTTQPALGGTPQNVPNHTERPIRTSTPVITPAAQPQQSPPKREENRQRTVVAPPATQPAPATSKGAPQHADQPKRTSTPVEAAPREPSRQKGEQGASDLKQKKVWKITTPENTSEKDNKDKERKDKERK